MPGLQGPLTLRTVEVLCDVLVRNDFTRPDQLRDAPMIVEWVGAAMLTGAESIFLGDVARGKRKRTAARCALAGMLWRYVSGICCRAGTLRMRRGRLGSWVRRSRLRR